MFVFPHAIRPRRPQETVFEVLWDASLVVNVAGFVIAFSDFYDRQSNTFSSYFGSGLTFGYSGPLEIIFDNCTYSAPVTIGGVTATSALTGESAPAGFLVVASILISVFTVHAILIVILAISLNLYAANIRHFRIGGTFLPIMTWLPTIAVSLCVALIALIWGSKSLRDYYADFVSVCATQYLANNAASFLAAEYDTNVIFDTNLNWIFAPVVISLGFYFLGILHHMAEGMRPGYVALAKAQYPWEYGIHCRVRQDLLVEWTKRRANLMETLEKGNAVAVSPFPQFATPAGLIGGVAPGDATATLGPGAASSAFLPRGGFGLRRYPSQEPIRGGAGGILRDPLVLNGGPSPWEGEDDGEPYVPGDEEAAMWQTSGNADEVVGAPDEGTDGQKGQKRRHRHRHRHRRATADGGDVPSNGAVDGGEDGERRHHHHAHRSSRRTRGLADVGGESGGGGVVGSPENEERQ